MRKEIIYFHPLIKLKVFNIRKSSYVVNFIVKEREIK